VVWQRFTRIVAATYFMRAGNISWTRNLFMPIAMESCSGAQTEYSEGYFHVFLRTPPIIQKSTLFFLFFIDVPTFAAGF
jgi:hypothetical protein